MSKRKRLKITRDEISKAFSIGDWGKIFPPVLDVDDAAKILKVPKATIYSWHSQGRLIGCSQRMGKHLRFFRDRLVTKLFNEGI